MRPTWANKNRRWLLVFSKTHLVPQIFFIIIYNIFIDFFYIIQNISTINISWPCNNFSTANSLHCSFVSLKNIQEIFGCNILIRIKNKRSRAYNLLTHKRAFNHVFYQSTKKPGRVFQLSAVGTTEGDCMSFPTVDRSILDFTWWIKNFPNSLETYSKL